MIDIDKIFKCPELKWSVEHLQKDSDLTNMETRESFGTGEGCSKIKTCKAYSEQKGDSKDK